MFEHKNSFGVFPIIFSSFLSLLKWVLEENVSPSLLCQIASEKNSKTAYRNSQERGLQSRVLDLILAGKNQAQRRFNSNISLPFFILVANRGYIIKIRIANYLPRVK